MSKKSMLKPWGAVKRRGPLMKRLKPFWEKHWEIIVVAILAFFIAEFILPMFLK